jgi:hypothetical protein
VLLLLRVLLLLFAGLREIWSRERLMHSLKSL